MNTPKRWVRTVLYQGDDGELFFLQSKLQALPTLESRGMRRGDFTIAPTADIEELCSLLRTAYVNSDARLIGGWAERYRALVEKREGETE